MRKEGKGIRRQIRERAAQIKGTQSSSQTIRGNVPTPPDVTVLTNHTPLTLAPSVPSVAPTILHAGSSIEPSTTSTLPDPRLRLPKCGIPLRRKIDGIQKEFRQARFREEEE